MHTCTAYICRTRAVVQATHSVTHTHTQSNQVIHQLIGTNNVQILRETVRAEQAEPTPYPGPRAVGPHELRAETYSAQGLKSLVTILFLLLDVSCDGYDQIKT